MSDFLRALVLIGQMILYILGTLPVFIVYPLGGLLCFLFGWFSRGRYDLG